MAETSVYRYRVIIEPYEDTGRWRWLRDRRWRYQREAIYGGHPSLDRHGYAGTFKAARKKALRGVVWEWGADQKRAEMEYLIETPAQKVELKAGQLSPRLLERHE